MHVAFRTWSESAPMDRLTLPVVLQPAVARGTQASTTENCSVIVSAPPFAKGYWIIPVHAASHYSMNVCMSCTT
ncbi:hypothetical protein AcV5_002681 [Taiwanofungus camphoratus]|nr:hypothetical protein AcV5_002681 [Antrodia cinnamomea]